MKEFRSRSQILFGFLPFQTVDLKGRVWMVKEWQNPDREAMDATTLRRELRRIAAPWAASGMDGGYVTALARGHDLAVYSLNTENGVRVVPFPQVWMCKSCNRLTNSPKAPCRCGHRRFGQLPFVGYHDACGAIKEPYIPRCKEHDDVRLVLPGTASAAEMRFACPTCDKTLRQGFGFPKCDCGKGSLTFTVHRAAQVYTPRTIVVVNPPSDDRAKRLLQSGGPPRALEWILDGLSTPNPDATRLTRETLKQQLVSQNIAEEIAEAMVQTALSTGQISAGGSQLDLPPLIREEAEEQAVTVAMATAESRIRITDMLLKTPEETERGRLYRQKYPIALSRAGLEDIELVDRFPVLTGSFGYTRGSAEPGSSRLVPFQDKKGRYILYADIAETESLFVRLRPTAIVGWLREQGFEIEPANDQRSARISLLKAVQAPETEEHQTPSAGDALLSLIHSYCHRFIRLTALYAGIERNSLSELLVPLHGGFFVYAAARGDFVLGGLQAVFETELDRLLDQFVDGDHRCPLDPGCLHGGGACVACLHLGEPSCRHYNNYLNRSTLSGPKGFLRIKYTA